MKKKEDVAPGQGGRTDTEIQFKFKFRVESGVDWSVQHISPPAEI